MDVNILILSICGLFAGFIDSVVGGGGLIQVPAMLILLPEAIPAAVFGTNKISSIPGTLAAMLHYRKEIPLDHPALLKGAVMAFIASFIGARLVSLLDRESLQPFIIGLLIFVLFYTLLKDRFIKRHAPVDSSRPVFSSVILAVGVILGFYDGFFGPGTGSFIIFSFVTFLGMSFLQASAFAKVLNLASNLAAGSYFIYSGNVLYRYAIPMALCNVIGAQIGTRVAIKRGDNFIKYLFLIVVSALILKLTFS